MHPEPLVALVQGEHQQLLAVHAPQVGQRPGAPEDLIAHLAGEALAGTRPRRGTAGPRRTADRSTPTGGSRRRRWRRRRGRATSTQCSPSPRSASPARRRPAGPPLESVAQLAEGLELEPDSHRPQQLVGLGGVEGEVRRGDVDDARAQPAPGQRARGRRATGRRAPAWTRSGRCSATASMTASESAASTWWTSSSTSTNGRSRPSDERTQPRGRCRRSRGSSRPPSRAGDWISLAGAQRPRQRRREHERVVVDALDVDPADVAAPPPRPSRRPASTCRSREARSPGGCTRWPRRRGRPAAPRATTGPAVLGGTKRARFRTETICCTAGPPPRRTAAGLP